MVNVPSSKPTASVSRSFAVAALPGKFVLCTFQCASTPQCSLPSIEPMMHGVEPKWVPSLSRKPPNTIPTCKIFWFSLRTLLTSFRPCCVNQVKVNALPSLSGMMAMPILSSNLLLALWLCPVARSVSMQASTGGAQTAHPARLPSSFPCPEIVAVFAPTARTAVPMTRYQTHCLKVCLLHRTTLAASPIFPTTRMAWDPAVLPAAL